LIATAIAFARVDSTFRPTHMNASPTAAVALFRLTMKAVPWVTLKAFSRLMGSLIHSRLRTALLIVASARRRIFPQQMAAACAFFARPHSTTAKYPHARPSAGSARQRLFPRQILIATAIAFARVDSTFRTRHKNASP
jgi:hypothetical protein